MWFKDANILICGIDVLGGAAGIRPSSGQGQTTGGIGRWFPPFSRMMFMIWNDLLMMIYYWILDEWWNDDEMFDWILNDCWNDYWILDEWWNDDEMFDWILNDCWNDYEMLIEFETMLKMLMFWNVLFKVNILLCCDAY
jgi:hypothetical protein